MKRKRRASCGKCGKVKESTREYQSYCRSCHNTYWRERRPKHSELTPEQRLKSNARSYANTYLKRGYIKRENCTDCGIENAQMHHEDYSKPIEIIWLCRPCHMIRHQNEKEKSLSGGLEH